MAVLATGPDIIDQYKGAEQQIAVALTSATPVLPDGTATENRNVNRQFRRSQQRNMEAYVDQVLGELDQQTADWVRSQLPTTYIEGVAKIALGTDSVLPVEWNLMHRQAATILAQDTMADLAAATAHMADQAKGFIRYAAKREVLDQVATGRAAVIGRQLAKRLQSQGLQAFVDVTGRPWKLSTYAEMVVRTKRQAAFNTGTTMRMHQQGVRACLIIDGTRHDSDCTAINGKTCSVPWSLDHPLEHPQCTRTFAPLASPPDTLDYGTLDDTLDTAPLSKVEPDTQLLYAQPPTIDPAGLPVKAGQVAAQAADKVELLGVPPGGLSYLKAAAPEPEPPLSMQANMEQHALAQGFDPGDLAKLSKADMAQLEGIWQHVPEDAKGPMLKGFLQQQLPKPPAAVKPVPKPPLVKPKLDVVDEPVPPWAHEAADMADKLGYDKAAFLAKLSKQQKEAGISIWGSAKTIGQQKTLVHNLAKHNKIKAGQVKVPGGYDPVDHDWLADFYPAKWDLDQAAWDQDTTAMKAALAKMEDVAQGLQAKLEVLDAQGAGFVLKVTKKQLGEVDESLAKGYQTLKAVDKLEADKLSSQLKTATAATDASDLADMAKATTLPKGSVLPQPDAARPARAEAPTHVRRHADDWVKVIDYDERTAVQWYTGSSYADLNRKLRSGGQLTSTQRTRRDALDRALAKAGTLEEPAVVWRGVRFSSVGGDWEQRADWAAQEFRPGSTLEWAGYSSTSTSPSVAQGFGGGGVIFEIEATQGVWVKPISSIVGEDEFLLPRNARFEVVNVIRSAVFGNDHRTVVQLRQIPT